MNRDASTAPEQTNRYLKLVDASAKESYHNSVLSGKNGQFIEAGDKIPPRSYVASYKDAEGEDREWVHRALSALAAHAVRYARHLESGAERMM
ncbi:hypothetical protein E4U54_006069 [Claviceps lovelessii]|nr:hypothetical protein E4U54_006069 [Claviceps lovelessii]